MGQPHPYIPSLIVGLGAGVQWLKGHSNIVQAVLREKAFALHRADKAAKKGDVA